jgi:PAS domain S-box-containing protein
MVETDQPIEKMASMNPDDLQIFEEASTLLRQMASGTRLLGATPQALPRSWNPENWNAELRYRALVEKIPAVTFVAGLDDTIPELYVSPQIEALLGFSQEEWLDNPFLWYEQLHPEDRHRWATEFAQTCATGEHFRSDYRVLARDGRVLWVHGECQVILDDEGHPRFLQGIAFDITANKQAEAVLRRSHDEMEALVRQRTAELAQSEGRLRAIVETAVDGIITIDEQGLILSFNPAAARLFGYGSQEVLGQNVKMLMPAPYHDEHDGYLASHRTTGLKKIIGIGREVIGRRKDGSTFPMDLAVSETILDDRRIFTGIIRDITLQKQQRHDLQQAKQAAEEASRAKDHFLAVLSHELRTPLTPVLGAVQLLESEQSLSPEAEEAVAMIRRNIQLEARIIDDLLDLTRITRGKVELRLEVVDAHASLRHALEVWQQQIETKGLELTLHLAAKRHHIRADPTRLQQVYWNLIGNAVKFTSAGNPIILRSANSADGRLIVQVSDRGIGIDAELLPRLFNAFEQGERAVTRRYGGLGLGLSISKALVEMHRGTLSAASEGTGKGATFTVSMDTVPAPAPEPTVRTRPADATGQKSRILLVEDHEDTLRVMARLLRSSGYHVITAGSIRAALEIADGELFDVLISDLGLPDGSGLDLIRQLLVKRPVKGIALSGYGMEEDMAQSKAAGFVAHLTKPVDLSRLEEVICQITNSVTGSDAHH